MSMTSPTSPTRVGLCYLEEAPSPIDSIPPEVLSTIMELCIADIAPTKRGLNRNISISGNKLLIFAPLAFSAVSARWRHVARSTSRIWTSLRLEIHKTEKKKKEKKKDTGKRKGTAMRPLETEKDDIWVKVELVRYYFERAKNLPISLLFVPFHGYKAGDDYDAILKFTLENYPTRIKELDILGMPIDWSTLDTNIYSQLRVLDISTCSAWESTTFVLPVMPMLSSLTLHVTSSINSSPPSAITSLHLFQTPPMDCIRLLLECKETIVEAEIQCNFINGNENGEGWFGNDQMYTLPRLEIFDWELNYLANRYRSWDRLVFQHLNMPSLRNIYLDNLKPHHTEVKYPKLFDQPSTLCLVDLCTFECDPGQRIEEDGFRNMLESIDTYQLTILGYDCDTVKALVALTPSSHPQNKLLVPNLKVLSLAGSQVLYPSLFLGEGDGDTCATNDLERESGPIFIQMLEERLLSSAGPRCTESLTTDPFVLALPFSSHPEAKNLYENGLKRFIDVGVLRLVDSQDVGGTFGRREDYYRPLTIKSP